MDNIKNKIDELKEKILENNKLYYEQDNPLISDYDYDMMMKELIKLEEDYPEYKTLDSPTLRVGGTALSKFEQITHSIIK